MKLYIELTRKNLDRERNQRRLERLGVFTLESEATESVRGHLLKETWNEGMFSVAISMDKAKLETDPLMTTRLFVRDVEASEKYNGLILAIDWEDRIIDNISAFTPEPDACSMEEPWGDLCAATTLALSEFFAHEQLRGGVVLKSYTLGYHSDDALERQLDDGYPESVEFPETEYSKDWFFKSVFGAHPGVMPIRLTALMLDSEEPYFVKEGYLRYPDSFEI